MSETTKPSDGGPAFPVAIMARQADGMPMTGCDFGVGGMSLRARIALQVLPECLRDDGGGTVATAAKELGIPVGEYDGVKHWPVLAARRAVYCADALIAELEK